MPDLDELLRPPGARGCLGSTLGFLFLAVISPFAFAIHRWRAWRRGGETRLRVAEESSATAAGRHRVRLDVTCDAPLAAASVLRARVTDVVVRIAELLRRPDDVYHLCYRPPGDGEAVILPVGPLVQSLGERFRLVLGQGPLAGRTAVWLVLGRDRSLTDLVDPATFDPECDGDRERLLEAPARWAMATSWARVGPSWVVRMILVVPAASADGVRSVLRRISG